MKARLLFLFSIFVLISCGANPERYMNKVVEKTYIGMPEKEFKELFKDEKVIAMKPEVTVYLIDKRTYHDLYGWRGDYRYFYFVNQKLIQVDKGERAVDYRIRID